MYRLAPTLIRSVEDALSNENAEHALGLLWVAMHTHHTTVDGLRLAALCARQLGHDEVVEALLRAGHSLARSDGDLIGAVDALRRLDALSVDTEPNWGSFLHQVAGFGFDAALGQATFVPPTRSSDVEQPTGADLLRGVLELAANVEPNNECAFSAIPLLDALPIHELSALLRSLQLRVAPPGTPILNVSSGAPAWITSGEVSHRSGSASPRNGSLVLPGDTGPTAETPVRLVALPSEVWEEYRGLEAITRPLATLAKQADLAEVLRNSSFFRCLSSETRHHFLQEMQCATLQNEAIIRRGEPVRGLFILVSGVAGIVDSSQEPPVEIATLHGGDVFGEFDVLTAAGAGYDVVAKGAVNLCLLEAHNARVMLQDDHEARRFLVDLHDQRSGHNGAPQAIPADS